MPTPLLSIVMPVYNVAGYLAECVDSIINQTFTQWELIAVNDGSTDDSLAVLERYSAQDARVRVISQPNGGYGKAMNAGLNAAQGEYVGIVESDDVIVPHMYERLISLSQQHKADMVKGGYRYFWDQDGAPRRYEDGGKVSPSLAGRVLCPAEEPECYRIPLYIWTGLYKRSWLEQWHIRVHETPGASYQDNGFWFQTLSLAQRAVWVDECMYDYRQTNANSSIHKKGDYDLPLREFDYIEKTLQQKAPERWQQVRTAFASSWWAAMYYTYNRIDPQYHSIFLQELSQRLETWQSMLDAHPSLSYREVQFLLQMKQALGDNPEQRVKRIKRREWLLDLKKNIKRMLRRS